MKTSTFTARRPYNDIVANLKQNQVRISEILEAIERRDISAEHVRESLSDVASQLRDLRKKIPLH